MKLIELGTRLIATAAVAISGARSSITSPDMAVSSSGQEAFTINGHTEPFTRQEINSFYQLDPLTSEACDPSSSTYTIEDCLEVYNRCNANPQKPAQERVTGCFEDNMILKDASGAIIGVVQELTGFDSNGDPSQPLYTTEK